MESSRAQPARVAARLQPATVDHASPEHASPCVAPASGAEALRGAVPVSDVLPEARLAAADDRQKLAAGAPSAGSWWCLPYEIMERIFSELSFGDQGRCALVCRLWYQLLPQDRQRQAYWLERCPQATRRLQQALTQGRRMRAYPFLQQASPEALHRLRCQEGTPWLPASLLYQFHKQFNEASESVLSATCDAGAGRLQPVFSACGRQLALLQAQTAAVPRLLSWRPSGQWQPWLETGVRVSCLLFDPVQERCFFFGDTQGRVWCQVGGAPGDYPPWIRFLVGNTLRADVRTLLMTAGARHLVALSYGSEPDNRVDCIDVFERTDAQGNSHHWSWMVGFCYRPPLHQLVDIAVSPSCEQLAIGSCVDRRVVEPSWCLRVHDLESDHGFARQVPYVVLSAPLLRLLYSPDGQLLFTAMAAGTAMIWRVEADALVRLVLVACHVHDGRGLMTEPLTAGSRSLLYQRWQPFSGDSQQLAVPISSCGVRMWRCEQGEWLAQEKVALDNGLAPTDGQAGGHSAGSDDRALATQLSDDGRVLVLISLRRLTVWYWQESGGWQTQLAYEGDRPLRGLACQDALLIGVGRTHCLVVSGPCGELAFYGPDSTGRFRRKAVARVGYPVQRLVSSLDGLSFATEAAGTRGVRLWHLGLPGAELRRTRL